MTHVGMDAYELSRLVRRHGIRTVLDTLAAAVELLIECDVSVHATNSDGEPLSQEDLRTIAANLKADMF